MLEQNQHIWNFPWLFNVQQDLIKAYQKKQLPHAALIWGATGVGKSEFCQLFAQYILCHTPEKSACQKCPSCLLYHTGQHSDILFLTTPKIDDIRKINDFCHTSPSVSPYKIIIITDDLNLNASNALLKILEEPPEKCYFLITSTGYCQLPETIRSRVVSFKIELPSQKLCQQFFPNHNYRPDYGVGPLEYEKWFEIYKNIIEDCYQYYQKEHPLIDISARWRSINTHQILYCLYMMVHNILRIVLALKSHDTDIKRLAALRPPSYWWSVMHSLERSWHALHLNSAVNIDWGTLLPWNVK